MCKKIEPLVRDHCDLGMLLLLFCLLIQEMTVSH